MDLILKIIGFVLFWIAGAWLMSFLKESRYGKFKKRPKDQYFKDEEKKRDEYYKQIDER